MGIRFSCHACAKPLNIKTELAGRRGICPECNTRFRIPQQDAEFSSPIDQPAEAMPSRPTHSDSPPSDGTNPGQTPPGEAASPASDATARQKQTAAPVSDAAEADDSLSSETPATWYVRPPSGGQYGPAATDVLKAWIREGRVAKNALLWRDGWPQWREASEALPEIADSLPGNPTQASEDVFSGGAGHFRKTAPVTLDQTQPIEAAVRGDSQIGTVRRDRSMRRMMLVGALAAVVVGLIIILIAVAGNRG